MVLGPGITPETVPEDVRSLVLVVNGRTDEKVKEARLWLDHLQAQNAPPTTILVMLGNEVRGAAGVPGKYSMLENFDKLTEVTE